ncbi:putative ribonuclease H-like domain-containing protein [Tanacetum coccineum]|uniref:Ribonuclease H-like domain-containing protein n=1 Tax=Tanacetum coccineum TaxID=301880 RepID=A0ABQ4XDI9_9ASTR
MEFQAIPKAAIEIKRSPKLRIEATDIGIFVRYAPAKKAFRIYNKRTQMIIETIHVDFDELTAMASEQFSSGPGTQLLPHETISLGLVQNIPSPTPYVPPTKNDWDTLFQPMEIGALLLRPQQVIIGGTLDQTPIVIDHPLKNIEDRGIFDSGCSGHMTGNKDHLDDFEECKGGSVTFGGSKGYITGKGRIRVGNLDFDNVSFIKELGHFNLFSISQICDKHHKLGILLATKDETSGILHNFIRQIENQLNHRVKIIRSDNGTEIKNRNMLEFCGNKGIKQEYSNAQTPQQNEVAEKMNRTLIEAAKTMLADSLLPTTFWAEAVNTACYIFNRVRVTNPQNKTSYELLFGHKPMISYIRPFGCHVTILDTLCVLGKFDGKSDEGFLVGYSLNSKAYRVYNLVTKRVEVNLHVNFLKEKPNVKGVGYRSMFDIDYLTDSMNCIPMSFENQTNPHVGTSEVTNSAGTLQTPNENDSEEEDEDEELIVVPTAVKHIAAKVGPRKSSTNSKDSFSILTNLSFKITSNPQQHQNKILLSSNNSTSLTITQHYNSTSNHDLTHLPNHIIK